MKCIIEMNDYWSEIDLLKTEYKPAGGLAATVDHENNIAYIYGGITLEGVNNKIYKFDLNNEKISIIDSLSISDRINHKMYYLSDERILIVSGSSLDNRNKPDTIELFFYDLNNKVISSFNTNIPFRGQFGSSINSETNTLFFYNGFGNNDYYSIDLNNLEVTKIELNQAEGRAGMICEFINPNQLFIFSGFSNKNGKSICHNDYKIMNTDDNTCQTFVLNEPFGRTFSKSILVKQLNKVLIFGGSPNGMETSGSFYFYDYKENIFNVAYIQPLPGERLEPAMIYSEKNSKVYIIGGLIPDGLSYKVHKNIMVLDLRKLSFETWLGHP